MPATDEVHQSLAARPGVGWFLHYDEVRSIFKITTESTESTETETDIEDNHGKHGIHGNRNRTTTISICFYFRVFSVFRGEFCF